MDGTDRTDGTDGMDGTDGTNGVAGTDWADGMDGMNGMDGMVKGILRAPLVLTNQFCKETCCFLEKITQLEKLLHEGRSRRS